MPDSDKPGDYLVVEDPQAKSTWHLQVKTNGTPDHRLMGAAWAALTDPNGHRGHKYEGPQKAEALAKLKRLYASENMTPPGASEHVLLMERADFVATRPGEPYRLLPFGRLFKDGVEHNLTPETAAQFRLPHFKPPVKLGSHADDAPAGGHIVGLEVRADGLYAIPEYVPAGEKALADGAYRYQSPEVIWEDRALEDPATGQLIPGPFIVGDALLHTPHLGERAALYSFEPRSTPMTDTVTIPSTFFEKLTARLFPEKPAEPEPKPDPKPEPDKLSAITAERDDYKTKFEQLRAEQVKAQQLSALAAELQNADKFGTVFAAPAAAGEMAAHILALPEGERDWFKQQLAAMGKQIALSNPGSGRTDGDDGAGAVEAFSAAIAQAQKDNKQLSYADAVQAAAQAKPELYTAWLGAARTGQKGS